MTVQGIRDVLTPPTIRNPYLTAESAQNATNANLMAQNTLATGAPPLASSQVLQQQQDNQMHQAAVNSPPPPPGCGSNINCLA
ncbi:MAG: hypothetical protein E7Z91_06085 [Cyanobacteria bacterium SIG30]|nr:hypothetical protein [Cyanobacteria bacterium SIG30]